MLCKGKSQGNLPSTEKEVSVQPQMSRMIILREQRSMVDNAEGQWLKMIISCRNYHYQIISMITNYITTINSYHETSSSSSRKPLSNNNGTMWYNTIWYWNNFTISSGWSNSSGTLQPCQNDCYHTSGNPKAAMTGTTGSIAFHQPPTLVKLTAPTGRSQRETPVPRVSQASAFHFDEASGDRNREGRGHQKLLTAWENDFFEKHMILNCRFFK